MTPKNKNSKASMEKSDVGAPKATTTAAASPVTRGNVGPYLPLSVKMAPQVQVPPQLGLDKDSYQRQRLLKLFQIVRFLAKRTSLHKLYTLCFMFLYTDQKRRKVDEKVIFVCVCVCLCDDILCHR